MIRDLLAEFGFETQRASRIVASEVPVHIAAGGKGDRRPVLGLQERLCEIAHELLARVSLARAIPPRHLATIPGVGIVCATALPASVTDLHQFRSSRQFAAWRPYTTPAFDRRSGTAGTTREDGRQIACVDCSSLA
jgi:transposase